MTTAPAELCGTTIAALWAVTVAWLIRRAARQYRSYESIEAEPLRPPLQMPSLGVVVPARNEAASIGRCLAGLRAQDHPVEQLRVVIVDDASSDATAALARKITAGDPRFRVIEAGPLPDGWTGKSHACWRGAQELEGAWLCFIDADTVPAPALLRSAVAVAARRGIDFLSLEPRQELVTPWERLILPAGLCALGFAGGLERGAGQPLAPAAANGQFILLRRAVYERVGGHRAVRGAIAEDSALATRVKAQGGRVALLGAAPLIAARMYRSLPQLWEGLAKNVTETFGGVRRTAVVAALGLVLPWSSVIVPLVLAVVLVRATASPLLLAAFVLALLASLAMLGFHIAAARYFAVPAWYGLLFPLAYTLAAVLAIDGMIARRRGRVAWKGRIYQATPR